MRTRLTTATLRWVCLIHSLEIEDSLGSALTIVGYSGEEELYVLELD